MSFANRVAVLALVAAIVAIVLAPACNLAPTSMRSVQIAHAILYGISLSLAVFAGILQFFAFSRSPVPFIEPGQSSQSLYCIRLC